MGWHCGRIERWAAIILFMCTANERRCYILTLSLIGWAQQECITNIPSFTTMMNSNYSSLIKIFTFSFKFHWSLFPGFQLTSKLALVQGMVWHQIARCQAIIWSNDDSVHRRIYMWPSLNLLNQASFKQLKITTTTVLVYIIQGTIIDVRATPNISWCSKKEITRYIQFTYHPHHTTITNWVLI